MDTRIIPTQPTQAGVVYLTPAHPRSETYTSRSAHGGRAGRETIVRYAPNRLAFCDHGYATLRYERKTSPPLIALLLVGFLAPVRPQGLP